MPAKKDAYLLEVAVQSTLNTESAGTSYVIEPDGAVDITTIRTERIARTQVTGTKKGALKPVKGLWHNQIAVNVPLCVEGLRVAAGSGAAAARTALSCLLASVLQHEALTTGAAATGTPTATSVIEGSTAHDVAPVGGATSRLGGALFTYGNNAGRRWRAYDYTTATKTMVLRMSLPAAPVAGDLVFGGYVGALAEKLSNLAYPLTVRFLTGDEEQNRKIIGAWAGLEISAVSPAEVAKMAFSLGGALGDYYFTDAEPVADPSKPKVFAGAEILLAPFGVTTGTPVPGRISIKVGGSWLKVEMPGVDSGLSAVVRGDPVEEVQLTVPHDFGPDSAGGNAASWEAILQEDESKSYDPADDRWHINVEYGQHQPGSVLGAYFPDLMLTDVSGGDLNSLDARVLTFKPRGGSSDPAALFGLS